MSMKLYKLLIYCCMAAVCSADLHQMVSYYETLDSESLQVVTRHKRNADGTLSSSKHISFQTLGRKFNLVLFPGASVLASNFEAVTVDREGRSEPFHVDPNDFYSGYLQDNRKVKVDAHFEDGIFCCNIYFPDDTYVIEPAWRHLSNPTATMITYRHSDVNWEEILPIDPKTGNRTRMKDGIRLPPDTNRNSVETNSSMPIAEDGKTRHKRAAEANSCPMLVVADYNFFKDAGNRKTITTAAFIIIIHTQYTAEPSNHYNADGEWGFDEKLQALSKIKMLYRFCLAHLFTSTSFKDNVMGIAYTGYESLSTNGGICSSPYSVYDPVVRKDVIAIPRAGLSTSRNSKNQSVLSAQQQLVVTHEVGHSWGSEHDPLTPECGPTDALGGKYVMWPISVLGYEPNNKVFSPCSKRLVSGVLRAKSARCFKKAETVKRAWCGNGLVEKNEECDPGMQEEGEPGDPCCTDCHLVEDAVCSAFHSDCCLNCQTAPATHKCGESNIVTCKNDSFCDGENLICPDAGGLPDGTPCTDEGTCSNGSCLNLCAYMGMAQNRLLAPCLCIQDETTMCQRCCVEKDSSENRIGACFPTANVLPAGRTCFLGLCEDGKCISKSMMRLRLLRFIRGLTVNKIMVYMKDNIVMTIILLTMVVWVPVSLTINYVDMKKEMERNEIFEQKVTLSNEDERNTEGPATGDRDPEQINMTENIMQEDASAESIGSDDEDSVSM